LVAAASIAILAGGTTIGACTPSTAGAPCAPGELAHENGHILRCQDGQFAAGETLEEFVKSFLQEVQIKLKMRAKAPETCPSADEVGTDSSTPYCPTPCPGTSDTGTDTYKPGC
jgi:hypothetical protein